jgi:hypothetical protein
LIVSEATDGWPVTDMDRLLEAAKPKRLPRKMFDGAQFKAAFPAIKMTNVTAAMLDGSAGILFASKILESLRVNIHRDTYCHLGRY